MPQPVVTRTLKQTRQALGAILNSQSPYAFVHGTLGSGSTKTTLVIPALQALPETPEILIGKTLKFVSGVMAGSVRKIVNWSAAAGTVTLAVQVAAMLPEGTEIEIYSRFTGEQMDDAITQALIDLAEDSLEENEFTITVTATDSIVDLEYAVPVGFHWIFDAYKIDSTLGYDERIWHGYWSVRKGASPKIIFDTALSLEAGDVLTVHGLTAPEIPAGDTSPLRMNPNYVLYTAASLLASSMQRGGGADPEAYAAQAVQWGQRAAVHRPKLLLPANSRRVR